MSEAGTSVDSKAGCKHGAHCPGSDAAPPTCRKHPSHRPSAAGLNTRLLSPAELFNKCLYRERKPPDMTKSSCFGESVHTSQNERKLQQSNRKILCSQADLVLAADAALFKYQTGDVVASFAFFKSMLSNLGALHNSGASQDAGPQSPHTPLPLPFLLPSLQPVLLDLAAAAAADPR